jgi:hypothetical protein
MNNTKIQPIFLILSLFLALACEAQAQELDKASAAAQANNPLANMTAFNIQDYYIGELTDSDATANQFWLRFAKPFSVSHTDWIMRASLPVNSYPTPPSTDWETGFGDLNVFAAYLIDIGDPAVSFGIGPQLTAPTATKDELGSGKWSAGLTNVLFNAKSHKFQYGYLLSWQASFAGDSDRDNVNVAAFQPFGMYQLGGGTYLRSAPIWVYNLENNDYSVPLGLGIGQIFKKGKTVYNVFAEPQFSIADKGPGQPEWQIYVGLNMQFLN